MLIALSRVIPAKAGIQLLLSARADAKLDPGLRRDDAT
jgi:hypothetical protein